MAFFSRWFDRAKILGLSGATDWHSHILPGVDDGVADIQSSLSILRDYELMGVEKVWLTPHVMEDVPNKLPDLSNVFRQLRESYSGPVRLCLASENMIDSLFIDRLDSGDVLPIGERGEMLLVETSYFSAPMIFKEAIEKIKSKGFYPLLAHPERYAYIRSVSEYKELKNMDVKFQLNLLSLAGCYGRTAKEKAFELLSLGFYDVFGSDIHHPGQTELLSQLSAPSSVIASLEAIAGRIR